MNLIIRILYIALNSIVFFIWATILTLEQFGILSVGIVISGYLYTLIDLGQTQIGASDLARLMKKNYSVGIKYLSESIFFKATVILLSSIFMIGLYLIMPKISNVAEQLLVIILTWSCLLGTAVCAPWMAIAVNDIKFYAYASIGPKLLVIIITLFANYFYKIEKASEIAFIYMASVLFITLLTARKYLYKPKKIQFNIVSDKRKVFKRAKINIKNSFVSLAASSYTSLLILIASSLGGYLQVATFSIADKICRSIIDIIILKYQIDSTKIEHKQVSEKKNNNIMLKSLISCILGSISFYAFVFMLGNEVIYLFFEPFKAKLIYESVKTLLPIVVVISISGWFLIFKLIVEKKYKSALTPYLIGGVVGIIYFLVIQNHHEHTLEISSIVAEITVLLMLIYLVRYKNVKLQDM